MGEHGTSVVLGPNEYGKAEIRLMRVARDGAEHRIADLSVSVALAGDLAAAHLTGDNSAVLPTDTQKNTVYAFARDGVDQIEEFGLRLARHFVESQPAVQRARVSIEEYGWIRLGPHSFAGPGLGVRTACVTVSGGGAWVVSGVSDLLLLNTTGSEFRGFVRDPYTTLAEASDRILATSVRARWRHARPAGDWESSFVEARVLLQEAFAETYSRSLQQTLYAMGSRVLAGRPELVEVRLSLPNRHHFLIDLTPFGRDNPDAVYHVDDRPYGLIEGTVLRDDAPPAGAAWD